MLDTNGVLVQVEKSFFACWIRFLVVVSSGCGGGVDGERLVELERLADECVEDGGAECESEQNTEARARPTASPDEVDAIEWQSREEDASCVAGSAACDGGMERQPSASVAACPEGYSGEEPECTPQLLALVASTGSLLPEFSPEITSYTLSVASADWPPTIDAEPAEGSELFAARPSPPSDSAEDSRELPGLGQELQGSQLVLEVSSSRYGTQQSYTIQVMLKFDGDPPPRPGWADEMGQDERGTWARFEVNGVSVQMRYIPPGAFAMGSPADEVGRDGDELQHPVTMYQGFWLAATECTQALWQAFEPAGESEESNPSRFVSSERPVETVSWLDVVDFVALLNDHVPGLRARLPTEAEWEYACRASADTAPYGGVVEISGKYEASQVYGAAWYGGNSWIDFELDTGFDMRSLSAGPVVEGDGIAGTHPVKTKAPNPWGLFDMLGNVQEWCGDGYGEYVSAAESQPLKSAEAELKVVRGGSWFAEASQVRSASRHAQQQSVGSDDVGFRFAAPAD